MAAKILVFLALLALSMSAATAVTIPQCFPRVVAPITATIPHYFPPLTAVGSAHSFVQSYRQQQAFAASISPLLSVIFQQLWAFSHQQFSAHLAIQAIAVLQQQLLLPNVFNQLAMANPTAYWQQQQLLPFSQLVVANPAIFSQLLPFNQLAVANPATFYQQQQLLPFNQLAVANPAAFWQQPITVGAF